MALVAEVAVVRDGRAQEERAEDEAQGSAGHHVHLLMLLHPFEVVHQEAEDCL